MKKGRPIGLKQFCKKGHDTIIVGRQGANRACNYCHRELAWKRYGISLTITEFDRMYQIQQGRCGICGIHQTQLVRSLSVDHNHETSEIRGLLCSTCNTKLGWKENNDWNIKADLYLSKGKK